MRSLCLSARFVDIFCRFCRYFKVKEVEFRHRASRITRLIETVDQHLSDSQEAPAPDGGNDIL